MKKNVPVLLLTGYLGSGKTTLLNRILANKRGIRFAVIVNDIGEVNIDASLIAKEGVVGKKDEQDLVALQNGCICCTLKMDLIKQLCELVATDNFDYIVIEASGICEPEPIAQTIDSIPGLISKYHHGALPELDCIVTVVDALRLLDEFNCGDALTKNDIDEEDIENLIIEQIEFCNIILLNKISEVTDEEAAHIKAIIRAIQPKAEIIECDYCDVDLSKLLDTHMFNFNKVSNSAAWVKHLDAAPTEDEEREAHELEHHHEHHHEHEDEHDHDGHEHHGHHHHHEEGHEHGEDGPLDEAWGIQLLEVQHEGTPLVLRVFDHRGDRAARDLHARPRALNHKGLLLRLNDGADQPAREGDLAPRAKLGNHLLTFLLLALLRTNHHEVEDTEEQDDGEKPSQTAEESLLWGLLGGSGRGLRRGGRDGRGRGLSCLVHTLSLRSVREHIPTISALVYPFPKRKGSTIGAWGK